jgi:hypothetical protein
MSLQLSPLQLSPLQPTARGGRAQLRRAKLIAEEFEIPEGLTPNGLIGEVGKYSFPAGGKYDARHKALPRELLDRSWETLREFDFEKKYLGKWHEHRWVWRFYQMVTHLPKPARTRASRVARWYRAMERKWGTPPEQVDAFRNRRAGKVGSHSFPAGSEMATRHAALPPSLLGELWTGLCKRDFVQGGKWQSHWWVLQFYKEVSDRPSDHQSSAARRQKKGSLLELTFRRDPTLANLVKWKIPDGVRLAYLHADPVFKADLIHAIMRASQDNDLPPGDCYAFLNDGKIQIVHQDTKVSGDWLDGLRNGEMIWRVLRDTNLLTLARLWRAKRELSENVTVPVAVLAAIWGEFTERKIPTHNKRQYTGYHGDRGATVECHAHPCSANGCTGGKDGKAGIVMDIAYSTLCTQCLIKPFQTAHPQGDFGRSAVSRTITKFVLEKIDPVPLQKILVELITDRATQQCREFCASYDAAVATSKGENLGSYCSICGGRCEFLLYVPEIAPSLIVECVPLCKEVEETKEPENNNEAPRFKRPTRITPADLFDSSGSVTAQWNRLERRLGDRYGKPNA